jgi:STE24 endopeptidase
LNIYLFALLILYILRESFEYLLQYLNLRHMRKSVLIVPDEFKGVVDKPLLEKIQAYTTEKTLFGFVSSLSGNVVTIFFLFGGLLNVYNSWVHSIDLGFVLKGLLFFLVLSSASSFLSVPFSLYRTFRIENKYNFNTMTPRLWITDFFKSLLVSTVITGILVSTGLWIIQLSPAYWWIWVWGFFLVFSLFIMYISPYVIEPLFHKFTPLQEEGLEEKIKGMMSKADISISRVFKVDASKRSRHTNAYFTGLGKVKRIVLYDTLLEKMDTMEILAVLAHEAGHWKKRHILKMIVMVEGLSLVGLYLAFRILQTDVLSAVFGLDQDTFFAKVVILGFIGGLLSFLLTPAGNYISRHFEKEADRFSFRLSGEKEPMISALVKLSKDNLSNLHPHPLYASFYYSHPPVIQRLREIRKL